MGHTSVCTVKTSGEQSMPWFGVNKEKKKEGGELWH